jgi:hypothetical protein
MCILLEFQSNIYITKMYENMNIKFKNICYTDFSFARLTTRQNLTGYSHREILKC